MFPIKICVPSKCPAWPRGCGNANIVTMPVVTMQNKCTQKWHKWWKTIVCFKARKTVTKNCHQRITLTYVASDYFLYSAQLADTVFEKNFRPGNEEKKTPESQQKSSWSLTFLLPVWRHPEFWKNILGSKKFQLSVLIIPRLWEFSSGKLKLSPGWWFKWPFSLW